MSEPVSSVPPWLPAFKEAAALGLRVAVVDTSAHMLACANLTDHLICPESALLGAKWHEFVEPRDIPAILKAFASNADEAPLIYRQLCRIGGAPVQCRIALVNVWLGTAWLCYGAVQPVPARRPLHWQGGQS